VDQTAVNPSCRCSKPENNALTDGYQSLNGDQVNLSIHTVKTLKQY